MAIWKYARTPYWLPSAKSPASGQPCGTGKRNEFETPSLRYRNPSTVKTEPILTVILEEYLKFKDEINDRRKKERDQDWKKLMKEQKRVMGLAHERVKQRELEEREKEAKAAAEKEKDVKTEL